jgi:hypothetical protein
MREKTCGSLLLLTFVIGLCALALGSPSPKWCKAGSVESLFTDCQRVASR